MAQTLDETQSTIRHDERHVFPPALEPARLEPPAHPALPRVGAGRLHFAPAPTDRTDAAATARRPRRRDWAERVYRLLWAVGS